MEEVERKVLEESWRQNGPAGPSLEAIDDDNIKKGSHGIHRRLQT
jgi:hypothetical protein